MTGLNIQFLAGDIVPLSPWGEGARRTGEGFVGGQEVRMARCQAFIRILRYYGTKAVGSIVKFLCKTKVLDGTATFPLFRNGRGKGPSCFTLHSSLKKRAAFTLAEGSTHVAHFGDIRQAAFTLAEVLITLGIIGVVAAMTMPALISNYQKTVYVNRLKKSVSVIENGFKMILADDGVDKLTDTGLFSTFSFIGGGAVNLKFAAYMDKYFKVIDNNTVDLKNYKYLNSVGPGSNPRSNFILEDGSYFMFNSLYNTPTSLSEENCKKVKELGGNFCEFAIEQLYIDVNGSKRPNEFGRDLFQFMVSNDGRLIPYGSKDAALFEEQVEISSNLHYWRNSAADSGCNMKKRGTGSGCAARVIENGWKMDY